MRTRPSKMLRRFAITGLLALAFLVLLQIVPAGRAFTVRSWVRLERLWSRDLPVTAAANWLRNMEPGLTAVGLLRPVRVEVEPGVSLRLDPADDIGRTILVSRGGRWEPEVWAAISGPLKPGAVFLDIGAHIGYDTLRAARLVGDKGLVVAFEPNPTTLIDLRANVEASDAKNVNVQPIALTDIEQQLTLFDARQTGNSGSSSLSAKNAGGEGTPYTVRGRRLDDVVVELQLRRVDVIKADVEGAEMLVMSGAKGTLIQYHPRLIVEILPRQLENMGTSVQALEDLIKSLGYNRDRWIDYKNKEYELVR